MRANSDTLAWRLRAARKQAGLTQVELAERAGTTQDMISKIERGGILQPRNIEKIANALGVSPAWLQFGVKEIDLLDANSIHFALAYQSLPEEKRAVIESVLKGLKGK